MPVPRPVDGLSLVGVGAATDVLELTDDDEDASSLLEPPLAPPLP